MCEGQSFVGSILGNAKQLQKIRDYLVKKPIRYLGYGKSAEYGKVRIETGELVTDNVKKNEVRSKKVLIELISPTIVYSRKAIPSTRAVDLIEEVLFALGLEEKGEKEAAELSENAQLYMKYTTLGGFNVTWNTRKPYIDSFDKGTSIVLTFEQELSIEEGIYMIGERNSEGYGECRIRDLQSNGKREGAVINDNADYSSETLDIMSEQMHSDVKKVLLALCSERFSSYVRLEAAIDADKWYKKNKSEIVKPTVSNMILMMKDSSTIEDVVRAVHKRFAEANSARKDKKLEVANKILQCVGCDRANDKEGDVNSSDEKGHKAENLTRDFCKKYNLTGFSPDRENVKMEYLKEFLIQIKYATRNNTREEIKEGEKDE